MAADDGADLHHPPDPQHVPARLEAGLGPADAGRGTDQLRPNEAAARAGLDELTQDLGRPLPGHDPTVGERPGGEHRRSWTTTWRFVS